MDTIMRAPLIGIVLALMYLSFFAGKASATLDCIRLYTAAPHSQETEK